MEFSTILTLVAMASMSTGTDGCIGQPELSSNTIPSNDDSIDHDHILEVESSGKLTCHSGSCPGKYFPECKDSRSCAFQCHGMWLDCNLYKQTKRQEERIRRNGNNSEEVLSEVIGQRTPCEIAYKLYYKNKFPCIRQ